MKSILVVSEAQDVYASVQSCFGPERPVSHAFNISGALDLLRKERHDFVFIDLEILKGSASDKGYSAAMEPFWKIYPSIEIVVMNSQQMIREAVMTVKAGASNYLTYPIIADEVRLVTEMIYESKIIQSELDYLRDQFWDPASFDLIHTKNPLMIAVYEKVRSVAPTKSTVLLIGETGTGKGILASLIHKHSNRRDAQFISVHCGAIPDTLVESELFGHEKGAFTGAIRRKLGKFEIAHEGTIFLDEIGTITPLLQTKLLQVLQDSTFQRVGGEETLHGNVRVIAATNMDLKGMCDDGKFRKDLYYRLNVFPIEVPPLRERIEDIPHLAQMILGKMRKLNPKHIKDIHPEVMDALMRYSWPGNIREMENLLERAFILETSSTLGPEVFPNELFGTDEIPGGEIIDPLLPLAEVRRKGMEAIEKKYLQAQLARNHGRINDTAKAAGMTTRQLHKLMKKHSILKEAFKPTNRAKDNGRA